MNEVRTPAEGMQGNFLWFIDAAAHVLPARTRYIHFLAGRGQIGTPAQAMCLGRGIFFLKRDVRRYAQNRREVRGCAIPGESPTLQTSLLRA